jgi:N-acetyltransferase
MIEPMELSPRVLVGNLVQLEPLTMAHLEGIAAAKHPEIWTYLDEETPTDQGVAALVAEALDEQDRGVRIPFTIVNRVTGGTIGSISYIDIQRAHHGVEIGWAWVTPSHWRTGAAREASMLLIRYAFGQAAIRVVFKTDSRNSRSQRAIEGLGAKREGIFRNHRILRDGHVRHSVFYGITAEDWANMAGAA